MTWELGFYARHTYSKQFGDKFKKKFHMNVHIIRYVHMYPYLVPLVLRHRYVFNFYDCTEGSGAFNGTSQTRQADEQMGK